MLYRGGIAMKQGIRYILKKRLLPKNSHKRVSTMKPEWITIHEVSMGTDVREAERNFAYYHNLLLDESKKTTIGYHFLVEAQRSKNPVIYQFLEGGVATDHTGNKVGNSKSIGIERLVNEETDFQVAIMAQAKLTATLMHKYNIPIENVVPHKHWNGKECPARLLAGMHGGWDGFIEKVLYFFNNKDFIKGVQ